MNLNPLFLNQLTSADSSQVISFPKLESQQFLFSNIIKVFEADAEIPQPVQRVFADEKPDLLISELSQILSALQNVQNLESPNELNEVPKLVNEKELVGKEFSFDKGTVKELINKIRELLDANKNLGLEVKKIPMNVVGVNTTPLKADDSNAESVNDNSVNEEPVKFIAVEDENQKIELVASVNQKLGELDLSKESVPEFENIAKVDSKPVYSFEIIIKTETKEVLVTIVPTNVTSTLPLENSNENSALPVESSVLINTSPVMESEETKTNPITQNSEILKTNLNPLINKSESKPSPALELNKVPVSNSENVPAVNKTSISNSEPIKIINKTSASNVETVSAIDNSVPSEIGSKEISENTKDINDGYVEAPIKQSKQSPIELSMPKKHFSVKVQDSSEKINIATETAMPTEAKISVEPKLNETEAVKIEPKINETETAKLETKLNNTQPLESAKSYSEIKNNKVVNSNSVEGVPAKSEKTEIPKAVKKGNIDSTEGKVNPEKIEIKETVLSAKVVIESEKLQPAEVKDIKNSVVKDETSQKSTMKESGVFQNVVKTKVEKPANNLAEATVAKETLVSDKPAEVVDTKVKAETPVPVKEAVKTETAVATKETVKAETHAPIKEAVNEAKKAETSVPVKEAVKTETPTPVKAEVKAEAQVATKEALKVETPAPLKHKENVEINKISDPITEKVKYSNDIDEAIPTEKNQTISKKTESNEINNVIEEKDYKVKVEIKNNSDLIASKMEKEVIKPIKELEIFEISGLMKSIKSESNKEMKPEETIKIEKDNLVSNSKKVAESEAKADTGSKNEFADKNLQQFTKNPSVDRVEAPKEKIFSELHNMQDSIRLIKSNEVVKEINKILARPETQSMTFQITPDELGKVKLVIDLINNHVSAKIEVESEQVRQIVQNNIEQLKSSIQSSGVQVSSLNVSLNYNEQKAGKNSFGKKKNSLNENNFEIEDAKEDNSRKKMGYSTVEFLA